MPGTVEVANVLRRFPTLLVLLLSMGLIAGRARAGETAPCPEDDAEACWKTGLSHARGEDGPRDLARAVQAFELACRGRHGEACYNAGLVFELGKGSVSKDVARAAQMYELACDESFIKACTALAQMYRVGSGVERAPARAFALSRKACEGGDAMACVELGVCLQTGTGVDKDLEAAASSYEKACKGEAAEGCYNIGLLYTGEAGPDQDRRRAGQWFQRGCKLEHAEACYQAGVQAYKTHRSDRARKFFKAACDKGFEPGCEAASSLNQEKPSPNNAGGDEP